jgi:hypothetical protein
MIDHVATFLNSLLLFFRPDEMFVRFKIPVIQIQLPTFEISGPAANAICSLYGNTTLRKSLLINAGNKKQ